MNYIILALAAALLFAVTNIIDKYILSKWISKPLSWVLISMTIESAIAFIVLLPWIGLSFPSLQIIVLSLLIGAVFVICLIPYAKAMMVEEASRVIPLYQLSPIFVFLMSYLFLTETLSGREFFGFALLVIGGCVVSIKRVGGLFKLSKAFWLMSLASFLWAICIVGQKYLFGIFDVWDAFLWTRVGAFLTVIAFFVIPKNTVDVIKSWNPMPTSAKFAFITSEVIAFVAFVLVALSLNSGHSPIVSALGGFQPLFVLVLAVFISIKLPKILKEELSKKVIIMKFAAIALMLGGLWLVYR